MALQILDGVWQGASSRLARLWYREPRTTTESASVPVGSRVYAIGDIHGRLDLLNHLHAQIQADAATATPGTMLIVVYLGDYVDRGLHSREVLDHLLSAPLKGFEAVHLRGNHDHEMLGFLVDARKGASWMRHGGDATIYSYGVRMADAVGSDQRFAAIQEQLNRALPAAHRTFLERTQPMVQIGDYLFVHAGIHPDKALHEQTLDDLLWIRDEFLEADFNPGKVIVHGHTVSRRPEVRLNRIGIDTGACYGNMLTCLVLEGTTRRFLAARDT